MRTFETNRLVLRQFDLDDWRDLDEYFSLADVRRYMPESKFSGKDSRFFCLEKSREDTFWAVCLKETNKMIGHIFLSKEFNPAFFIYEIGYMFNPAYQRRGYAAEACRRIMRHGFEDLKAHRIIATCDPENTASWRLMERLNMRREAHFIQCLYLREPKDNQQIDWRDEYTYGILKNEWEKTQ